MSELGHKQKSAATPAMSAPEVTADVNPQKADSKIPTTPIPTLCTGKLTPKRPPFPPVPPIYTIGPPNGGSALRHGHHIEPVDFEIDHGQASPCSFRRIVPPNTMQGHADAGSIHVAAERN